MLSRKDNVRLGSLGTVMVDTKAYMQDKRLQAWAPRAWTCPQAPPINQARMVRLDNTNKKEISRAKDWIDETMDIQSLHNKEPGLEVVPDWSPVRVTPKTEPMPSPHSHI